MTNKVNELSELREKLDFIDSQLLNLLKKRFEITKKVGDYKAKNKLPSLDENRENKIYENLKNKAKSMSLNEEMIKNIWKIIMNQSKKDHEDIKKKL